MSLLQNFILQSFNAFDTNVAMNPLLILDNLLDNRKEEIPENQITNQTSQQIFSSEYDEYSTSQGVGTALAASVGIDGNYGFFSGSVQASASENSYLSSTFFSSGLKAKLNCGTMYYSNRTNYNQIKSCLTDDFNTALDAIATLADAKKFTDTYGTHLVLGIRLGGTILIDATVKTQSYADKKDFSIKVNAAYNSGLSSIGMVAQASYELDQNYGSYGLLQSTHAIGGDATLAAAIDPAKPDTMLDWANSCTQETSYGISDSLEIWELASNETAQKTLKKYIHLLILAQSISNPTIFSAHIPLQPFILNNAVATVNNSHFRIIGGGATVTRNCSSWLAGSYPQTDGHDDEDIMGWIASSHDSFQAANNGENLTAYAIAVYDPSYDINDRNGALLNIKLCAALGHNPGIGIDSAKATMDSTYILTGGGCELTSNNKSNTKFISSSYPDDQNWVVYTTDYVDAASNVTLTATAIGIQCPDLDIYSHIVATPGIYTQHGDQTAKLGNGLHIAGGGVKVSGITSGNGNLVQETYPSSHTSWTEYNKDAQGSVTVAESIAYAISLKASVKIN